MEELTEMPSIINRKKELQITKKLLAIIGSFFVINLAVRVLFFTSTATHIVLIASISDCFTCMNSGVNIIIYGMMDTRYRNVFKTMFCKGCTGEIEAEGGIVTRTKVTSA